MGRPRVLGPTIPIRLPVELHAIVAARAEAKQMSVEKYLTARIVDSLQAPTPQPPPPSSAGGTSRTTAVNPRWKASMKT